MKKILLTIALVITMGIATNAQTDGFFGWNGNYDDYDRTSESGIDFNLPEAHGTGNDYNSTPLGSGIVILTALGGAYLLRKKDNK